MINSEKTAKGKGKMPTASVMNSHMNMGWSAWGVKEDSEEDFCARGRLLSADQQDLLDQALRRRHEDTGANGRERSSSEGKIDNNNKNNTRMSMTNTSSNGGGGVEESSSTIIKKKGRGMHGGRGRGKRVDTTLVEKLPSKIVKGKINKST